MTGRPRGLTSLGDHKNAALLQLWRSRAVDMRRLVLWRDVEANDSAANSEYCGQ